MAYRHLGDTEHGSTVYFICNDGKYLSSKPIVQGKYMGVKENSVGFNTTYIVEVDSSALGDKVYREVDNFYTKESDAKHALLVLYSQKLEVKDPEDLKKQLLTLYNLIVNN